MWKLGLKCRSAQFTHPTCHSEEEKKNHCTRAISQHSLQ